MLHRFKGGMGDAQACYRPQRGQRSVDRHKECPSKRPPYPQRVIEPAKMME
jgi:hypothetical protein